MTIQEAQQIIDEQNSGKRKWDDNERAAANNLIDAADPVKQAMKMAQQAQQMQIQANQPAIATLNQTKTDLDSKYKDLISSITSAEQPALDSTIKATNNELGKRGITGDSSLGQQQIAGAQLPVTTQFGQLQANTGLARQKDMSDIAANIAQLQTGNVGQALNYGGNIAGIQNQAQQIANNYSLGEKQLNQPTTSKTQNQIVNVGGKGYVIDPISGQVVSSFGGASGLTSSLNNSGYYGASVTTPSSFQPTNHVYNPQGKELYGPGY